MDRLIIDSTGPDDDVFTVGFTMREVTRAFRAAGALEVAGVVLARKQRRLQLSDR